MWTTSSHQLGLGRNKNGEKRKLFLLYYEASRLTISDFLPHHGPRSNRAKDFCRKSQKPWSRINNSSFDIVLSRVL